MAINPDAAFSTGDVMRRLAEQDGRIAALETARRLPAASIGSGGLRLQGGRLLAEDASGERVFEVTTEPPDIFMRPELIATVARQVIGESVFNAEDSSNADVNYPSGGFIDPDAAGDPGPEISNVEISDSGRAVVTVGAGINTFKPPSGTQAAYMGFVVTGASSVIASITRSAVAVQFGGDGTGSTARDTSRTVLLTGLSPGLHTFTVKYSADIVAGTASTFARFTDRYIQVIAF